MLRLQISTSSLNVSSPLEHPCPQEAGISFPLSLPLQRVVLKKQEVPQSLFTRQELWVKPVPLGWEKIMQLLTNGLNQVKSGLKPPATSPPLPPLLGAGLVAELLPGPFWDHQHGLSIPD